MLIKLMMIAIVLVLLIVLIKAAYHMLLGHPKALGRQFQIRVAISLLLFVCIIIFEMLGWISPSSDLIYLR